MNGDFAGASDLAERGANRQHCGHSTDPVRPLIAAVHSSVYIGDLNGLNGAGYGLAASGESARESRRHLPERLASPEREENFE